MKIFILGPANSGKTTAAAVLAERYGICHIKMEELLQDAFIDETHAHSATVLQGLQDGAHIQDSTRAQLICEATRRTQCKKGYILDGYPETLKQANALNSEHIHPDAVIELIVQKDVMVKWISGRWFHKESGRMYHSLFAPPRVAGRDDVTHGAISQHSDDKKEAVIQRMDKYEADTIPLRSLYEPIYKAVDGHQSFEEIRFQMQKIIEPLHEHHPRRWYHW